MTVPPLQLLAAAVVRVRVLVPDFTRVTELVPLSMIGALMVMFWAAPVVMYRRLSAAPVGVLRPPPPDVMVNSPVPPWRMPEVLRLNVPKASVALPPVYSRVFSALLLLRVVVVVPLLRLMLPVELLARAVFHVASLVTAAAPRPVMPLAPYTA